MRDKKHTDLEKKVKSTRRNDEARVPEFETPSQRRNRDGVGRGPNGSDGSSNRGRGSNH